MNFSLKKKIITKIKTKINWNRQSKKMKYFHQLEIMMIKYQLKTAKNNLNTYHRT